ncbi:TonB-dependent receptor [Caulobacter radicis]|uniref:TonB-dependent receptor n=1 Tax=Caulobacter radicis TaxID=2172650 RepID=A0A2T9JDW7_9CAUL|nr:TonB-dependent receptor [Caulobacter radicis]PVM81086.1 TonB-dependent receptor [Caulobacter radicis]
MRTDLRILLSTAALAAFATPLGAAAQSATQAAKPAPDETVEEIVVTALKRSTTLQTTPMSISAVTGDSLQKIGATGLQDYFRSVPGVNLTQGQLGQSRVTIRGVQGSGEATTGLYYDETSVTGPSGTTQDPANNAADLNLFDVERVEVLRGPQGTLYGGGSMGGTIRVIYAKPDSSQFGASVEGQASTTKGGSRGSYLKAMGNIPLIEGKLAARIVAYTEDRPGFVDNVRTGAKNVNDSHADGYRAMLGFTPTDDISLVVTKVHQNSSADDLEGWYDRLGDYKTDSAVKLPLDTEMDMTSVTGKWSSPIGEVTASSAYYKYDMLRTIDFTPQYRPYIGSANGVIGYQPAYLGAWNHELRLSSKGEGQLQWTVGGYMELRKDHIDSNTVLTSLTTGQPYSPMQYLQGRYVNTGVKQTAQFGEATWTPPQVEGLSLTVGARHYDYTKTTGSAGTQRNLLTGAAPAPYSEQTAEASGWVYKFNASYKVTSDVMVYATAAEGFRPGGANNVPGLNSALVVYNPDSLWNYEAGVKTTWLGGKVTANAAAYRIDWKDRQTSAITADGLYSFITNAGAARIEGLELEVAARPIHGLTLNGSIGYTKAELTEDQANANILVDGSTGKKGDRIANVPDWTASASAQYVWPLPVAGLNGLLRADYAYTGEMVSTFRPTYVYFDKFGSFSTVNLRAGVEGEDWGVYAFVTNLTDAEGIMNKNSNVGYQDLLYGLTPRTVGVNARRKF